MTYKQLITFSSDQPIEWGLLLDLDYAEQKGIALEQIDSDWHTIQEAQKLIKEKGVTSILSIKEFNEAVLPKVDTNELPLLIKTISDYLQNLAPHNKLIIIDRYLFPDNNAQKVINILASLLLPLSKQLSYISFIISSKHDHATRESVEKLLKNSNDQLVIDYCCTEEYHDRFWIIDEERGMFVGTSVSGIGNRYSLVDYLKEDDIKAIVSDLKRKAFL